MPLEPMTEDEMYAVEFHPCELHEELPDIDDTDTDPSCPTCDSADIAYAMRYSDGPGDEDCEWAQCRHCGWDGPAEDILRQPAIRVMEPSIPAPHRIEAQVARLSEWWRSELAAIGVKEVA
jgi:hypothetical protein